MDPRTKKLDLLLALCLSGFVFAAFFHYFQGMYLRRPWPLNTFLFDPALRCGDFDEMLNIARDMRTAATTSWYPPAANAFFHLLGYLPYRLAFAVYYLPILPGLCWFASRCLQGVAPMRKLIYLLGIFIVSYPFLFAVDRGNLDMHLLVLLGAFALCYGHSPASPLSRGGAVAALSVAISLKAYPAVLAVVYLKDRRYKELGLVVLVATLLTWVAAGFQGGLFHAIAAFVPKMGEAAEWPIARGTYYSLNLFNAGRLLLLFSGAGAAVPIFETIYTPVAAVLLIALCVLVMRRSLRLWQSLTAVICGLCLLPTLALDYRAALLLVPLGLFIKAETPWTTRNVFICVLFGLLLIPKGHFLLSIYARLFPGVPGDPGTLINPLLLLALTVLVLLPTARAAATHRAIPGGRSLLPVREEVAPPVA